MTTLPLEEVGSTWSKLFTMKLKYYKPLRKALVFEYMRTQETKTLLIESINLLLTISSIQKLEDLMQIMMAILPKNIDILYMMLKIPLAQDSPKWNMIISITSLPITTVPELLMHGDL